MGSQHERLRTLAFARLVGHLLGDGSISVNGQGRVNVGQAIDRESVLEDVERITGKRPAGTRYDERKWSIALPMNLTAAITQLDGVHVGYRIHQAPELPRFVLDPSCPTSVLREYLGGVFGADGWAPALHRTSSDERSAGLVAPACSQTAKEEHVPQLREMMSRLVGLLDRCGVSTHGHKIYEYATRRSATTYARRHRRRAAGGGQALARRRPLIRRARRISVLRGQVVESVGCGRVLENGRSHPRSAALDVGTDPDRSSAVARQAILGRSRRRGGRTTGTRAGHLPALLVAPRA
jgi:hypothetical protein